MEITCLQVGQLQTNCYLAWDKKTFDSVVIDPGDDADYIIQKIKDLGLKTQFILATHGHFDHVLAVTELRVCLNIPFMMSQADLFLLNRQGETSKYFTGSKGDPAFLPDKFLKEGDEIVFGEEILKVLETPGHTPGGICFHSNGILFSGDTLFDGAVGRTDLSYSSPLALARSLKKLSGLPRGTRVYPGHGEQTEV